MAAREIAPGTPTQVAHPGRTAWRTFVQNALLLVPLAALALPEILEAIASTGALPEGFRAWAAAAAVVVSGLVSGLARIMALPSVNALLEKYRSLRLGSGVETER